MNDMSALKAAVGDVLVQWGMFEDCVRTIHADDGKGLAFVSQWERVVADASVVAALKSELVNASSVRNLLAHGIVGATVGESSDESFVTCRDRAGERHQLTHTTLVETARTIDRLRRQIVSKRV